MFGLDDKQDKIIANRVDWLTKCFIIVLLKISSFLKIELPPPPEE